LPGKALQVALAIRYRCAVERTRTVKLASALLRKFGLERDAKARALRQLEAAGLIACRASVVAILWSRCWRCHRAR
jgi:DNA-binding MarR family transcriptional regulator